MRMILIWTSAIRAEWARQIVMDSWNSDTSIMSEMARTNCHGQLELRHEHHVGNDQDKLSWTAGTQTRASCWKWPGQIVMDSWNSDTSIMSKLTRTNYHGQLELRHEHHLGNDQNKLSWTAGTQTRASCQMARTNCHGQLELRHEHHVGNGQDKLSWTTGTQTRASCRKWPGQIVIDSWNSDTSIMWKMGSGRIKWEMKRTICNGEQNSDTSIIWKMEWTSCNGEQNSYTSIMWEMPRTGCNGEQNSDTSIMWEMGSGGIMWEKGRTNCNGEQN
ncbi:hypothetical protein PoB_006198900 [Plakobranchus ocellatus]|uniref:Uncharacterized protein n=1 Tax=Plakobranchus ocellatus TaxID=259542 RepID=A0AAV4CUD1_9GAST|nr:hypothetical protein PoB_006198900 [Plakobranchus ocellatus]